MGTIKVGSRVIDASTAKAAAAAFAAFLLVLTAVTAVLARGDSTVDPPAWLTSWYGADGAGLVAVTGDGRLGKRISVGPAGHELFVSQDLTTAWVHDKTTGQAYRIDPDGASLGPSVDVGTTDIEIIVGGGRAYALDTRQGTLREIRSGTLEAPTTLPGVDPDNEPSSFHGTVDRAGFAHVVSRPAGVLVSYDGSSKRGQRPVGEPGDALDVTTADTMVIVANGTAGNVQVFAAATLEGTQVIDPGIPEGEWLLQQVSLDDEVVWIAAGQRLWQVSLEADESTSTSGGDGGGTESPSVELGGDPLTPPVASGGRVIVMVVTVEHRSIVLVQADTMETTHAELAGTPDGGSSASSAPPPQVTLAGQTPIINDPLTGSASIVDGTHLTVIDKGGDDAPSSSVSTSTPSSSTSVTSTTVRPPPTPTTPTEPDWPNGTYDGACGHESLRLEGGSASGSNSGGVGWSADLVDEPVDVTAETTLVVMTCTAGVSGNPSAWVGLYTGSTSDLRLLDDTTLSGLLDEAPEILPDGAVRIATGFGSEVRAEAPPMLSEQVVVAKNGGLVVERTPTVRLYPRGTADGYDLEDQRSACRAVEGVIDETDYNELLVVRDRDGSYLVREVRGPDDPTFLTFRVRDGSMAVVDDPMPGTDLFLSLYNGTGSWGCYSPGAITRTRPAYD